LYKSIRKVPKSENPKQAIKCNKLCHRSIPPDEHIQPVVW
jgi:hypothetical protein